MKSPETTESNAFTYKGEFKKGVMDGFGDYECDGYSYKGAFKNNKKHGNGVYQDINGHKICGDWFQDANEKLKRIYYYDDPFGHNSGGKK